MPSALARSSFSNRFSKPLYNALIRRNSAFIATIFAAAFAFDLAFEEGMNSFWDRVNRGRQWKDIRHKYE